jgi:alkanesulfonate monooxygenase SsuD/methylene tetrahydromethanopterin reductase-like flavin-dependent oxidoreductase (luciferase family)
VTRPKFGYCLPIFANPSAGLFRTPAYDQLDPRRTLELGVHAESVGFDSLWVADHLMLGKDEAILEGWTTLSALGGATSRALLGMIHQAHYFRPPALTAKMTATLDQLTGGRLIMFYDFGRQQHEHGAYGFRYPDDADIRARECVEGIELIMELWNATDPVSIVRGRDVVTDAVCAPEPLQRPHPPIWFGELEPALLTACARFGQGWNTTPVGLAELERRLGLLRAACAAEGRGFEDIEVSAELQVLIGSDDEVRAALAAMLEMVPNPDDIDPELLGFAHGMSDSLPDSFSDTTLMGKPEHVAEQIEGYVDAGVDHFLLWFLDAPLTRGMEQFATEVISSFGPTL